MRALSVLLAFAQIGNFAQINVFAQKFIPKNVCSEHTWPQGAHGPGPLVPWAHGHGPGPQPRHLFWAPAAAALARARAHVPMGPWAQGPGRGPMAHGPAVAMYFHKERRFLHYICTLKRILGDEFLSKFSEFLSEFGEFLSDFCDFSVMFQIFMNI